MVGTQFDHFQITKDLNILAPDVLVFRIFSSERCENNDNNNNNHNNDDNNNNSLFHMKITMSVTKSSH